MFKVVISPLIYITIVQFKSVIGHATKGPQLFMLLRSKPTDFRVLICHVCNCFISVAIEIILLGNLQKIKSGVRDIKSSENYFNGAFCPFRIKFSASPN